MDIRTAKLKEIMELVKPAVPRKPTLKVAAYVCLGNGKAVATDLETMIIANAPEATETMLLPYSSIAEVLKYVPSIEMMKIESKGKVISLSWKGGKASYPTEDYAEFPIMPELATRGEGLVDGDALLAALNAALPYVAVPVKGASGRPVLEGITLVLGTPLEVAAGDSFRMSHQVLGLSFPLEEKIVIPSHAVATIEHVFKKTPRTPPSTASTVVQVATAKRQLRMSLIGDNKLRLDFGTSASVVVNLILGEPPKWLDLIPKGDPILQSQIFALQFEAAVKRVRDVAKEGSGIVRMEFADGQLKLSAKHEDQEISTTIDTIYTHGEPGRVGINQSYLLDYLSGKQGMVTFSKYTESGPVVLEYQKTPKVLIMPMQVQWDDQVPVEEPKTETPADETTDVKDESEDSAEPDSDNSAEPEETEAIAGTGAEE